MNNSCFNIANGESDSDTIYHDAAVDFYDIVIVNAAGNDGDCIGYETTISPPADAYNIISVGSITDKGTTDRSDDDISWFSSYGPTLDGRKKPDIVAPGSNIRSANHNTSGFIEYSGTSMATPHVAGAAAILMHYGLNSKEVKALLINSAEDKGNQSWDRLYGWGSLDLDTAYDQKDYTISSNVTNGSYRFYKKENLLNNEKITLVWNRHITYSGASLPAPANRYPVNNLDLLLFNETDNSLVIKSEAAKDNVEQVQIGTDGAFSNGVIKVYPWTSIFSHGSDTEDFALSTWGGYIPKNGPAFSIDTTSQQDIFESSTFTISCNITNNGDLTAHNVNITLNLYTAIV